MVVRQYNEELQYLEKLTPNSWKIKKGFQPNMNVEGIFYVNNHLEKLMFDELRNACRPGMVGGFLPGVKQIANVAALPGIVGRSIGLPDVHSGYGFAIGNMAAFDMGDPKSVVSPGGVGFDINCGVRLLRTNLMEKDVLPVKEQLAQSMFDHIPVGVGSKGIIPMTARDLEEALEMGMDWSLREGYVWAEDKEHCEEYGRMLNADPSKVSMRAKKRGLPQCCDTVTDLAFGEIQKPSDVETMQRVHFECIFCRLFFGSFQINEGHELQIPGVRSVAVSDFRCCTKRKFNTNTICVFSLDSTFIVKSEVFPPQPTISLRSKLDLSIKFAPMSQNLFLDILTVLLPDINQPEVNCTRGINCQLWTEAKSLHEGQSHALPPLRRANEVQTVTSAFRNKY
ncbi:hypothetical protein J6590_082169 [Homalodisca vitripennis]|nr:hypothetical protein J6590_082169 [Homalodisca vitripennis]